MKRILSLFLVFMLLVNVSAPVSAATHVKSGQLPRATDTGFEDMVSQQHWAYLALINAIDVGIMEGSSGRIRPDDKMTRAELVTMINNAAGLGGLESEALLPYQTDISGFTDVNSKDWYYDQMAVGYNLKLIEGISPSKMAPKNLVTREQAFKILSSFMALDLTEVDATTLNHFKDVSAISSWAMPYVAAMVDAGYVSGFDGYLKPGEAVTRQEFAQLLFNLFNSNFITNQRSADTLSNQTVIGNLIVSTADITLKNIKVTGDMIIGDGVGNGDVNLEQVEIAGRLIIRGGGENSIYLNNTSVSRVIVTKLSDGSIRLYGADGSGISYMEIQDGKDSVIIDCDVENLFITSDEIDIVINENVKNLSLSGDRVHISGSGRIDTIRLEKGVTEVLLDIKDANVTNLSDNSVKIVDKEGKSISISTDQTAKVNTTVTNGTTDYSVETVTRYSVNFYSNGGTTLTQKRVVGGSLLGELPVPQKENAIFVGWFTDDTTFDNGVANDTKVSSNLDLYAKYITSDPMDQRNMKTVASVMDVAPTYAVTILSSNTAMTADQVKAAITFETLTEEASEFAGISVTGSGGTYIVSAIEGYTSGSSYSIILNEDALSFSGEIDSVRTYNLSVVMAEPVLNLQLSDTVKFVPESEITNVTQNGQFVDSIFAPLYTIDDSTEETELYGTFTYLGSQTLAVGNQVAIYSGTLPNARLVDVDYSEQPISYVNISAIDGNSITYGNSDPSGIIFMPDVLPVDVVDDQDGDLSNNSITIDVSQMTFSGVIYQEMGLTSSTTVDIGDYLAFYSGDFSTTESVTYAEILTVSLVGGFYVIGYEVVNEEVVLTSMDMASSADLDYEAISSSIGIEETELAISQQVEESGFAEAAADYLIALSQADEDTRRQISDVIGIENFSVISSTTATASRGGIPDVKINVTIDDDLEYYSGKGIRCYITVSTVVELSDDLSLTISGTFVEEFQMRMRMKSKTIWKRKGIFPYIADYKATAVVDLYNYTYLALNMNLKSESSEGWSDEWDIADSIETIKDMSSQTEANNEVREFYQLYQEMMAEEHAYFPLFDKTIAEYLGYIDPLCILAYSIKVDFVVSLDANVALGSEFSYEKATRYIFSVEVKSRTTSSKEIQLKDEEFNFNVYAMGELGIRAGIRLSVSVGLFSTKLNSVGISAEVGAYYKIWGFIFYELASTNGEITTKTSGACYMEVGIYFTTAFKAQIGDGKVEYKKVLYSDTWPLWHAGSKYYIYDFKYTLDDSNDDIVLKGNEPSYTLPTWVFRMLQMDFKTGEVDKKYQDTTDFTFTIKDDPDKVFAVSDEGVITVTPPKDSDLATATLEITWNKSPLSFTSVPISRTFELKWDNLADSYLITLDTNGGDYVNSIEGAYNKAITLPIPTREGYVFDGWYLDNDSFSEAFIATTMPATNKTVYAKWIADVANYTVYHYQEAFESGDYILVNTDILVGTTESNVTPAVRTYTGFEAPATQTITVLGGGDSFIEYYYARSEYHVTFVLNNGSSNMVSALKYESEIVAPKLFRAGYEFTGWNNTVVSEMPAEDLSYSALWSLETYTITYDLDGGSENSNPENYTINSGHITLNNPTKANYVFAGWVGTGLSAENKSVTIESGGTGNRYYTATWKVASDTLYSVYHYRQDIAGNYTILEVEARKGTAGENTEALAKAYPNFTANAITQEVILQDESTSVEIRYDRTSYVLTFDAGGGDGGNVISVRYEGVIEAPLVTRTGYSFVGWNQEVLATMPAENITFTAQWVPVTYSITFEKNVMDAIGIMEDIAFTYDQVQNLTANIYERDGYTFIGWNTEVDGSGTQFIDGEAVSNLTTIDEENVVLYAQWAPITYTITFNKNHVDATGSMSDQGFTYDVEQNLVDNGYALTGYTFVEWNTASDGTGTSYTDGQLVSNVLDISGGNVVLYAQWSIVTYSITFSKNAVDATGVMEDMAFTYGVAQNLTANTFERAGYTFIGWTTEVGGSGTAYAEGESVANLTIINEASVTLYAQWAPITYTITFNSNHMDATGSMSDQGFTYDVEQNLVDNGYALTGYTFVEWNTASDGTGTSYTDGQLVSNVLDISGGNVVLYAQWVVKVDYNAFDIKYSAQYQVFDAAGTSIGGRAYDSSWGSAGASFGHQFTEAMLSGRYFVIRETGSASAGRSIALYMYESDGTPVTKGISTNLYDASLIGLSTNINLDDATRTSLETLYGANWAMGLASVGTVTNLWDEGFIFLSQNGFGHFFSGKAGFNIPVVTTKTNLISSPTIQQLKNITDFVEGPLVP